MNSPTTPTTTTRTTLSISHDLAELIDIITPLLGQTSRSATVEYALKLALPGLVEDRALEYLERVKKLVEKIDRANASEV